MSDVPPTVRLRLCVDDLMRSRIPLFDGVERVLKLAAELPAFESDRDVAKLRELLGFVDHLPIGAARAHWQAEALHRVDRELMALERQHQDSVFYSCRRLLSTLER